MSCWAIRGKYTDTYSDEEILINFNHFEFYLFEDCMENGKEKFNLDFLGRWRKKYFNEIKNIIKR